MDARRRRLLATGVAVLLASACDVPSDAPTRVIETSLGPVEGTLEGDEAAGRFAFLGLPYAEPPIGPLRFRPPRPATPFGPETRDATELASPCIQPTGSGVVGSEDCLYLNVWTPDPDASLPVMVWIHGGFFAIGGAHQSAYDGGELAERGNVVVVSIQYRLGALGHLAHESLEGDGDLGAGNYAFMDQALALRWVQREIAAFGGDPSNVTLFGQSAGGTSVCTALLNSETEGLFHRAIVQSQHCGSRSLEVARVRGAELVDALGCAGGDVRACLAGVSARAIARAQVDPTEVGVAVERLATSYQPTIDGRVLTDTPAAMMAAGAHHPVPVLSSSVSEDAFFLLEVYTWELLDEAGRLLGIPEAQRASIAEHYQTIYSVEEGYPPEYARGMLATDLIILCPESEQLRRLAAADRAPAYRLLFDYAPADFYAEHGIEIPYLFQHVDRPEYAAYVGPEDREIERWMLDTWTGFARDGTPPLFDPPWPEVTVESEELLVLREGGTNVEARLHANECAMFGDVFD